MLWQFLACLRTMYTAGIVTACQRVSSLLMRCLSFSRVLIRSSSRLPTVVPQFWFSHYSGAVLVALYVIDYVDLAFHDRATFRSRSCLNYLERMSTQLWGTPLVLPTVCSWWYFPLGCVAERVFWVIVRCVARQKIFQPSKAVSFPLGTGWWESQTARSYPLIQS